MDGIDRRRGEGCLTGSKGVRQGTGFKWPEQPSGEVVRRRGHAAHGHSASSGRQWQISACFPLRGVGFTPGPEGIFPPTSMSRVDSNGYSKYIGGGPTYIQTYLYVQTYRHTYIPSSTGWRGKVCQGPPMHVQLPRRPPTPPRGLGCPNPAPACCPSPHGAGTLQSQRRRRSQDAPWNRS